MIPGTTTEAVAIRVVSLGATRRWVAGCVSSRPTRRPVFRTTGISRRQEGTSAPAPGATVRRVIVHMTIFRPSRVNAWIARRLVNDHISCRSRGNEAWSGFRDGWHVSCCIALCEMAVHKSAIRPKMGGERRGYPKQNVVFDVQSARSNRSIDWRIPCLYCFSSGRPRRRRCPG